MSNDRTIHLSRRHLLKAGGAAAAGGFLAPNWLLSQAVAQDPVSGGTITLVTEADWVDLEPHLNGLFAARQATQFVYENLLQLDANLQPQPCLAESFEVDDANQTFTFHLRQGVTWHDGSPFVAADVVYSLERVLNPDNAASGRTTVATIDSVTAVDDATVVITTSVPKLSLPVILGTGGPSQIIKAGSTDNGDLRNVHNGTGPFTVGEIVSGDYIRFVKNPNYWNQDLPYVDELIFKLMVEEDTRVAWIRSGQADYVDLYAEAAARLADDENVTIIESQKAYMMGTRLRVVEGPLADSRVRKALDMATDRQDMIEKARFGAAELTGFIPAGQGDWSIALDKLPAWYAARDVEGAKALLAEAGVSDLTIEIKCSRPEQVAIALVAKENWAEIGVNAEVLQMEYGAYFADLVDRNFQAIVVGQTFIADPVDYLFNHFHSTGSGNVYGFEDAEVDAKLDEARATVDSVALKAQLDEIQQMMWDRGAPYQYAYNALNIEGLRTRVQGYEPEFTAMRKAIVRSWIQE